MSSTDAKTIMVVKNSSESLSEQDARQIKGSLSKLKIKNADIHNFDPVAHAADGTFLILVGNGWHEVSDRCIENGMTPGKDYAPLWHLEPNNQNFIEYQKLTKCSDLESRLEYMHKTKKIACIFGNCQSRPIMEIISQSEELNADYQLVLMPFVQSIDKDVAENGFNESFLKSVDLLVTMNITEKNKFSKLVSTEHIKKQLSDKCRVIIIPNCYFTAYFPQIASQKIDYLPEILKGPLNQPVSYNDCYAESAIQNDTEITHPTAEDVIRNQENTIIEMINREKNCDIAISDYILENYRDRRIFYSRSHPTVDVLTEEVNRLLSYLGYSEIVPKDIETKNERYKEYIYPEVYETLGLKFRDDEAYINKAVSEENMDEETYLSLIKMFKKPEYWKKSIKWINEPMKKSIDFSANISASNYISIKSRNLGVTDSATQLSLTISMREDVPQNTTLVQIPECMSPSRQFISFGKCTDGRTVKIKVNPNGHIDTQTPMKKDDELVMDLMWLP